MYVLHVDLLQTTLLLLAGQGLVKVITGYMGIVTRNSVLLRSIVAELDQLTSYTCFKNSRLKSDSYSILAYLP